MEFRVDNSQFSPNHGGGGGGFYRGRRDDEREERDEDKQEAQDADRTIGRDACLLPRSHRSALSLAVTRAPEPIDLQGLDEEIHRNVRIMTLMMIKLENDFARRLQGGVGEIVIGTTSAST